MNRLRLSTVVLLLLAMLVIAGAWLMNQKPVVLPLTVVQARKDLPAYTVITSTDIVTTTITSPPANAVTDVSEIIGHTTNRPIESGATLTKSMLIPIPQAYHDWWLLTIPVSSALTVTPGNSVILLGVDSNDNVITEISQQAVVLDIKNDQIVLALAPDEARQATMYLLPDHQLIVLRSLY